MQISRTCHSACLLEIALHHNISIIYFVWVPRPKTGRAKSIQHGSPWNTPGYRKVSHLTNRTSYGSAIGATSSGTKLHLSTWVPEQLKHNTLPTRWEEMAITQVAPLKGSHPRWRSHCTSCRPSAWGAVQTNCRAVWNHGSKLMYVMI